MLHVSGDSFDDIQSGFVRVPVSDLLSPTSDDTGLGAIRTASLGSSALTSDVSGGSGLLHNDMGIRAASDAPYLTRVIVVDQNDGFRFPGQVSDSIGRFAPTPSAPPPSPTQQQQINFIAGVDPSGVIVSPSFSAWNNVAHSNAYVDPSSVAKWGAGVAGTAGGTVTYAFDSGSGWLPDEISVFTAAYALWSDVANITFQLIADPATANIVIKRGAAGTGAFFSGGSTGSGGAGTVGGTNIWHFQSTGAFINLATADSSFGPVDIHAPDTAGGHVWGTIVHEEGHSLGLGHSGPYNGSVTPSSDQFSVQDNTQYSIMSYIDPTDATGQYFTPTTTNWGVSPDSFGRSPTTPMMLDFLAAQQLYGVSTSATYAGGQIYGFHCNISDASKPFYDFTVNSNPVVTIWNKGTGNTLDLSGFSTAATVNLNPGTFSSCDGLTNNIGIALNTQIDKFVGGTGADTVTGNNNGDLMDGSFGGNDNFTGGTGNDGFSFAAAFTTADFVNGGAGANDQVGLQGNYSAGLTIGSAQLQGVEVLALLQAAGSYLLTLADSLATGASFSVWSVSMTGPDFVNVDASLETSTNYNFYLGQGNDTAKGGSGADLFYGEGGQDTLTGGAGIDTFAYLLRSAPNVATDSSSTNYDIITDFSVAADKFHFGLSITGVNNVTATLNPGSFDSDVAAAVAGHLDASHAVLINSGGNGFLVVEANGTVGYQANGDFVIELVGVTSGLTSTNFN